jgi:hypothetical protein
MKRRKLVNMIPEMNSNDSVPLLLGHSRKRLIPQDTSVSNQDVDTTESVQRSLDEGFTILGRTHGSGCFTAS